MWTLYRRNVLPFKCFMDQSYWIIVLDLIFKQGNAFAITYFATYKLRRPSMFLVTTHTFLWVDHFSSITPCFWVDRKFGTPRRYRSYGRTFGARNFHVCVVWFVKRIIGPFQADIYFGIKSFYLNWEFIGCCVFTHPSSFCPAVIVFWKFCGNIYIG